MSSRPLLEGHPDPEEPARLRREIIGLEKELADAKAEAATVRQQSSDAIHAIRALRKQTEPLYMALKMIHGEMSRVDANENSTEDGSTPNNSKHDGRIDARAEFWKQKLGGNQAQFITLLLEHGEMTTAQLVAAAHCGKTKVGSVIYKLKKAGILNKNGGRFSLKL